MSIKRFSQEISVYKLLLVLVAFITLSACDLDSGISELQNTEWTLLQLRGKPLIEGTKITLKITDERIEGGSGCNFYFADEVFMEKGEFSITEMARTLRECAENIMEQEQAFQSALAREAEAFQVTDDRLEFHNTAGDVILVFTKSQADS